MNSHRRETDVPLEDWVRAIIGETVAEHKNTCPLFERVRKVEIRFGTMIGYMAGGGVIGGSIVAVAVKLLSG